MAPTEGRSTEPEWVLRPAVRDDLGAMAEVHLTARAAAPMPASEQTHEALVADFAAGWEADEFWVVCERAVEGDQVLGYVRFVQPDAERVGWLDDLYVAPRAAGQGVGSALLDLVKAQVRGGFGLWAFEQNTQARRFYRQRGLREVARVTAEASPTGEPEVELRWP